jgi:hypothetical protein
MVGIGHSGGHRSQHTPCQHITAHAMPSHAMPSHITLCHATLCHSGTYVVVVGNGGHTVLCQHVATHTETRYAVATQSSTHAHSTRYSHAHSTHAHSTRHSHTAQHVQSHMRHTWHTTTYTYPDRSYMILARTVVHNGHPHHSGTCTAYGAYRTCWIYGHIAGQHIRWADHIRWQPQDVRIVRLSSGLIGTNVRWKSLV